MINNVWGSGIVIRDSHGYVVALTTWCVECFPDYDIGEALGIRLVIQFSIYIRFFLVVFKGDSLNAVCCFRNLSN